VDVLRGGRKASELTLTADSLEIIRVIKQVARLNKMLAACGILDKSKYVQSFYPITLAIFVQYSYFSHRSFVSEGLHDLEVLCQLSPQQLEGLGLNMGARVKLTNEIESLRNELCM
jgi:hypothetical protein